MSTRRIPDIFSGVASPRAAPSQPPHEATRSSDNTTVTSSNPDEDNSAVTSSTARDDLAPQSSAGTVTSPETMSPPDHGEPPSTLAETGVTPSGPVPPAPAAPGPALGGDPELGPGEAVGGDSELGAGEAVGGGQPRQAQDVWLRRGQGRVTWQQRAMKVLPWVLGIAALTALLALVACMLQALGLDGGKRYAVSPTDMRAQGDGFAAFCSKFNVNGSVPFSAFLLDHPATIDPHNRLLYRAEQAIRLPGLGDTMHESYYLLPGSNVTTRTCLLTAGCVDLLVFRGESDYDAWRDDACSSCHVAAVEKMATTGCRSFSYVAPDPHTYYFVFVSCQHGHTIGSSHVLVNRSVYDVSDARYAWENTTSCVIQPPWDTASSVVWQAADFKASLHGEVSTSCHYRWYMLLIMLGLFLFFVIVLWIAVAPWFRNPPAPRLHADPQLRGPPHHHPDENTPLLAEEAEYDDPSHRTSPPPSYAEAQRLHRS